MSDIQIIGEIIHRLSAPVEVERWFCESLPEIRDAVLAVAKADGLDAAVKDVRELYACWLQQRH